MKASLLSGIASLLIVTGGSSFAADMPLKAPAPIYVSTWTGGYIGVSGGGMSGSTRPFHGPNDPLFGASVGFETDPFKVHGGLAGITDGCNVQFGSVVVGYESDTSISLASGQKHFVAPVFNPSFSDKLDVNDLSTWRARAGYLVTPDWLIYGTGGAALAGMTFTQNNNFTASISDTKNIWGWAGGGGVEWRFAPNFSLKAEYIHVGFRDTSFNAVNNGAALFLVDNRAKLSEEIVRIGLNMKFDPWSILFR